MVYGLTETGFIAKTLLECKAELEDELKTLFGADIDLTPQSAFGQLVGIASEREAQAWDTGLAIYLSSYPDSATGISLDRVCSLTNITRLPALPTTGTVILYGVVGTVIGEANLVTDTILNKDYIVMDSVTLTASGTRFAKIQINTVVAGNYTVTINGTPYTVTATGAESKTALVDSLVALIGASGLRVGEELTVLNATTNFAITTTGNLSIVQVGNAVDVESTETGVNNLPIGAITSIKTPVAGWDAVNNLVAGIAGVEIETDADLRLRRTDTVELSILTALLTIQDVTDAVVYENNTHLTDADGTLPNTIWAVVKGGSSTDILEAIASRNVAGIGTRGATSGLVTSPFTGSNLTVRFDRPTVVVPNVVITYTKTENSNFPNDGEQLMKDALVAYGETLKIGQDIVYSRLFSPLNTVVGMQIDTLTVNGASATLAINKNQLGSFVDANITVTETP
jgi:uncharacterized phage protein gp47/JayE